MTKYFMKGTEDEVQFGDTVSLSFRGEKGNGEVEHEYYEVKFSPIWVDWLLEQDVIEEKDIPEEKTAEEEKLSMFKEDILKMLETQEMLLEKQQQKIEALEGKISKLKTKIKELFSGNGC